MNSKELNDKISELGINEDLWSAFGGKPIPYIGWFWRTIDFDSDHCYLGVVPKQANPGYDEHLVGFMGNNKWGYPSYRVQGEEWQKIKDRIVEAVNDPSEYNLKALHYELQATSIKHIKMLDNWTDPYEEMYE